MIMILSHLLIQMNQIDEEVTIDGVWWFFMILILVFLIYCIVDILILHPAKRKINVRYSNISSILFT